MPRVRRMVRANGRARRAHEGGASGTGKLVGLGLTTR